MKKPSESRYGDAQRRLAAKTLAECCEPERLPHWSEPMTLAQALLLRSLRRGENVIDNGTLVEKRADIAGENKCR